VKGGEAGYRWGQKGPVKGVSDVLQLPGML
jgi:hypothetical protein